jgi:cytidylate kinase
MAIITISRQVSSFGDEIASVLSKNINHQLVDQAQVHQFAQACDSDFSEACRLYEKEAQPGFFERMFFNNPAYTSLFESLNLELASKGDIILIGRGAQVVLRNIPGILKVRVVAPTNLRIQRLAEQRNISKEVAGDFVRRHDHQRAAMVRSFFDKDLRDWALYDLIVNTTAFSIEAAADLVAKAVDEMHYEHTDEQLKEKLKLMSFGKRIESALKKHILTSAFRDINVTVSPDGVATLSGYVQDVKAKEMGEKIAKGIEGVNKVVNELRTTELRF